MSKLIILAGIAIRQDKVLAVSADDTMTYPSIKFYLQGNETILVSPFTDKGNRDICYDRIVKQIQKE